MLGFFLLSVALCECGSNDDYITFNESTLKLSICLNNRPISEEEILEKDENKTAVTIEIDGQINEIPEHVFEDFQKLTDVFVKSNIIKIGEFSFYGCNSLVNFQFNNKETQLLESIEACAFANTKIKSFVFSDSLRKIGASSFENCTELRAISLPDVNVILGEMAFKNTGLAEVVIQPQITEIPNGCFAKCVNMKNLTIIGKLDKIDRYAFAYCTNLESLIFTDDIEVINETSFYESENIKKIIYCGGSVIKGASIKGNYTVGVSYLYKADSFCGKPVKKDDSGTCQADPNNGRNASDDTDKYRTIIISVSVTGAIVLSIIITVVTLVIRKERMKRFDSISSTVLLGNV